MKKSDITRYTFKTIAIVTTLLYLWLIIANLSGVWSSSVALPISAFISIVIIFIFCRYKVHRRLVKTIKNHPRTFIVGVAAMALIFRFSFLFFEYKPFSDPGSFLEAASNLANVNTLGDRAFYVASFPFTLVYDILLSVSIKIFHHPHFSIILFNTIFDFLGAFLLFKIVKKHAKKSTAMLASCLWLLFPFNIIFSALALPITVVNFLLFLNIYIVDIFLASSTKVKKLSFSLLLGLTLFLLNIVRPFAIIICIAIFLATSLQALNRKKAKDFILPALSLLIVFGGFFTLNQTYFKYIVPNFTHQAHYKNLSGWSIYVGANYESNGRWNQSDADYYNEVVKEEKDLDRAFSRLQNEGITRYKNLSPNELFTLFVRKSVVLGGDQYHMIYNLGGYPQIWENKDFIEFFYIICALTSYSLLVSGFTVLYKRNQKKSIKVNYFILFTMLLFLGLFFSGLLVEVANRYFAPFFVLQFLLIASQPSA